MRKQAFAHPCQRPLADHDLQYRDQVFKAAGGDHGHQVDGTIADQQIDFAQPDGFIDNPFLHFQGDHPG